MANSFESRHARLVHQMSEDGIDAYLATSPAAMGYLRGFFEDGHERIMMLATSNSGQQILIAPALSQEQAERTGLKNGMFWKDGEDPIALISELGQAWNLKTGVIAVDPVMRSDHLLLLQNALPAALFRSAGSLFASLASVKDDEEIARLVAAGRIADEVYEEILGQLKEGMTEIEIQSLLEKGMKDRGGRPDFAIVGIGEGSAEPHHINGGRALKKGDLLLLDFGCTLDHYRSDITRCVSFGPATDEAKQVYKIVYQAFRAGHEALKPGATGQSVDAAARKVIEDAGYGPQFMHRLGHGIGMLGHEEPNLVKGNLQPLVPGNSFSIEPGIYLGGKFGIRLENCVAVTSDGYTSFNCDPPGELLEI